MHIKNFEMLEGKI